MLKKNIQFYQYTDYAHPKADIQKMLYTALEATPSKQSTIPYQVLVLGPDETRAKGYLYQGTIVTPEDEPDIVCEHNHQVKAPWVLLFYERSTKSGKGLNVSKKIIPIEIGMFCANFTQLCLNANLNVSYTRCFVRSDDKIWEGPVKCPILALSVGKGEKNKYMVRGKRPKNDTIFSFK